MNGRCSGFDGAVNYYLLLEHIRSGKTPKEVQKLPIYVFPSVSPPVNLPDINYSEQNRKELSVDIKMEPSYILFDKPELPLEVTIKNPRQQIIREIKVLFVRKCIIDGNKTRTALVYSTIPGILNLQLENFHDKFLILISEAPLELPPAYTYSKPFAQRDTTNVYYSLKVEFCVNGIFSNIKFKIPVFVANKQ